jgi:hypothetical protein
MCYESWVPHDPFFHRGLHQAASRLASAIVPHDPFFHRGLHHRSLLLQVILFRMTPSFTGACTIILKTRLTPPGVEPIAPILHIRLCRQVCPARGSAAMTRGGVSRRLDKTTGAPASAKTAGKVRSPFHPVANLCLNLIMSVFSSEEAVRKELRRCHFAIVCGGTR